MTNPVEPLVSVRGLSKRYGRHIVYQDLSFAIQPGESVVVLGPSGSGKSVLFRLLLSLEIPDAGTVTVAGLDAGALHTSRRRLEYFRPFGVVFQSSALFDDLTLAGNVALALDRTGGSDVDPAAHVAEALTQVRLDHAAQRFPHEVSGGMQRRAALARAVAGRPRLLLLDEPTSGLDPESEAVIASYLHALRQRGDITLFTITHSYECACTLADTVYAVSDRRNTLVRCDDPAALTSPERLRQWCAGIQAADRAVPVASAAEGGAPRVAWWEGPARALDLVYALLVLLLRAAAPPSPGALAARLWDVAVRSAPLIGAAFVMVGMALALQASRLPLLQELLPRAVAEPVFRSIGPLVTALLLAGRVGSSISAEVGALRVNGQLTAWWTLGRDPDTQVLPPLFWACVLGTPVLTGLAMAAAVCGGAVLVESGLLVGGVTTTGYFEGIRESWRHFPGLLPLLKSLTFGMIIGLTGYAFGSAEKTAARAVGQDVTRAVVAASLLIIVTDFLFSWFI